MYRNSALIGLCVLAFIFAGSSEAGRPSKSGNFCQGCRSMVSFLTNFNSTSSRSDNKELFKNFCELYQPVSTDFRQGPCPLMVEGLFYILQKIDPVYYCDDIGACKQQSNKPIQGDDEGSSKYPLTLKDVPVYCEFCQQAIKNVQGALEDPKTIDILKSNLKSFCNYLAVIGQREGCEHVVDNYVDQAIDFVRTVDPVKYCQSISLCPTSGQQQQLVDLAPEEVFARFRGFGLEIKTEIGPKVSANEVVQYDEESKKVKRGPNCAFCKTLVKEMFKFLKENRTEANIRVVLDKVCKLVYHDGDKYEQCTTMVASYTREFVEILVEETDPELICMLLEQCTYQKQEFVKAEPINMSQLISMLDSSVPVDSMKTCIECKLFFEYLRDQFENPKTESEAKEWLLNNLCLTLPDKKMSDSCVEMINAYADTFFKALAQEMEPKAACAELHACPSKPKVLLLDNLPVEPERFGLAVEKFEKPSKSGSLCEQCMDILNRIDDYLSTHPLDHDVNVLVEQVCNKITNESVKNQCTYLVRTFGLEIVQAITHESPKEFCTEVLLC